MQYVGIAMFIGASLVNAALQATVSAYRALAKKTSSPVIIQLNKWGETYKPLSRLPQQAVQSNMVYR